MPTTSTSFARMAGRASSGGWGYRSEDQRLFAGLFQALLLKRGLGLEGLTTAIAVAAHRAHGTTPPLLALVPVVLAAWGIAYALAGRRIARWELLALLGAAQLGIHGLSVYLTAPVHHDPGPPGIGDSSTPMVLTHVAATVLTALLLEHGERMWWGLLSLLGARYRTVRVRDLPPPVRRPVPVASRAVPTLTWLCAGPVGMRAPPLLTRI